MTDCSRCTATDGGPTYEGECAFRTARTRPSPCADATTEDMSRTPIVKGMRVFNYYDCKWGYVLTEPDAQGWFLHGPDPARGTSLNGVRVSMVQP